MKTLKWFLALILLIVAGWIILRSNNRMNMAERELEIATAGLERVFDKKYELCGNVVVTFKTHSDVQAASVESLEKTRLQAMDLSFNEATTTRKGPSKFSALQNMLNRELNALADSIHANDTLTADANFEVLFDELGQNKPVEQSSINAYNKKIADYNAVIRQFPNSLLNNLFGYKKRYRLDL
jgi:LemA protein